MKRKQNKGFTLAELLIVVAIIAVLVAISIPIFNNQRRKARLAVNQANAKAAEEMAMTAYLTEGKSTTAYFCKTGSGTKDGYQPIAGTGFSYTYSGSYNTYVGGLNITTPIDEWTVDTSMITGRNYCAGDYIAPVFLVTVMEGKTDKDPSKGGPYEFLICAMTSQNSVCNSLWPAK